MLTKDYVHKVRRLSEILPDTPFSLRPGDYVITEDTKDEIYDVEVGKYSSDNL